jgi:hypothetical protein
MRSFLALGAVFTLNAGCGGSGREQPPPICTAVAVSGVTADVVDGQGRSICDAVVTATAPGGKPQTLMQLPQGNSGCNYAGLTETPGKFTIEARRGSLVATQDIVIAQGICHVQPVHVTLALASSAVACNDLYVPAVDVHVVDGNGADLCDAIVTVAGPNGYSETLKPTASGTGVCAFWGGGGAGHYTVTATAHGATAQQDGDVAWGDPDQCHPKTVDVQISLP